MGLILRSLRLLQQRRLSASTLVLNMISRYLGYERSPTLVRLESSRGASSSQSAPQSLRHFSSAGGGGAGGRHRLTDGPAGASGGLGGLLG